jgi:hypothetical protein
MKSNNIIYIIDQIAHYQTKASKKFIKAIAFDRLNGDEESLRKCHSMFKRLQKMMTYGWEITNNNKLDFHTIEYPTRLDGWSEDGKKFIETQTICYYSEDETLKYDIMDCVEYDENGVFCGFYDYYNHMLFRNEKTSDGYFL